MPLDFSRLKDESSDSQQLKHLISFLAEWYSESKEIEQFTSGSTSTPKKIYLDKEMIVASAERTASFFGLNSESVLLVCLGLNYIAGKMQLARAMVSGSNAIIIEPDLKPLKKVDRKIDFATMVPAQFSESLEDIDKVGTLLLGGGSISQELRNQLNTIDSTSIWIGYGMTETYSHIALRQLSPHFQSAYTPMSKVEVVLNSNGCLSVKDGVLNLNLQTSDIAELRDDGTFRILGRADSIINSGGRKIQPERIEGVLGKVLTDEDFLLSSVDHPVWGQELILLIVLEETDSNRKKVEDAIRIIQDSKDRPKRIVFVNEIVKTWNGKVNREANREEVRRILAN